MNSSVDDRPTGPDPAALVANVVWRVSLGPDDDRRLRPPQLEVIATAVDTVNSFCIAVGHERARILVGRGLYPYLEAYTRAAAARFLPAAENDQRPSEHWSKVRDELCTELQWIALPMKARQTRRLSLAPYQQHVAEAFATYAYRFALCHELGHVALEHVSHARSSVPSDDNVLRVSQQMETEADRFGFDAQVKSIPAPDQLINAVAGSLYFLHAIELLRTRLMLLTPIIDFTRWEAKATHPPPLGRTFTLLQYVYNAIGEDSVEYFESVDNELKSLDGEVMDRANHMVDESVASTRSAIAALDPQGVFSRKLGEQLETDIARSPIGVLVALDETRGDGAARVRSRLPEAMQQFLDLNRSARTDRLMGRPTTDGKTWER